MQLNKSLIINSLTSENFQAIRSDVYTTEINETLPPRFSWIIADLLAELMRDIGHFPRKWEKNINKT